MKVVQGILDIGIPYIPHQVWEHDIYIFTLPQPAVHICIDIMVPEVICADAYARILLFRKSRIPETQEIFLRHGWAVGTVSFVGKETLTLRKQTLNTVIITHLIFCKFSGDINPAAFGPFGLKNVKISFIQIGVLLCIINSNK